MLSKVEQSSLNKNLPAWAYKLNLLKYYDGASAQQYSSVVANIKDSNNNTDNHHR